MVAGKAASRSSRSRRCSTVSVKRRVGSGAALAAVLISLLRCSTLKVDAGWDHSVDFAKYKTWAWRDDGSIRDPVWLRRVQSVLEDELEKKGMTRSDSNADVWVFVHARLTSQTHVVSYSPAWGYGWGYWAGPTMTEVYEIPVGTLLIDFVDPQRRQIVWRGSASDAIRAGKENEEREQRLREILDRMFAGYPPPRS
jgi:hypothetical protein